MRRTPAILLLALFSISLLTPAFRPDADANLPACCRRGGKHHCSIATGSERTGSGVSFQANPRCPMYPPIMLYSGAIAHAWIAPASSLKRPDTSYALGIRRDYQPVLATDRSRAHQKRGPPSLS